MNIKDWKFYNKERGITITGKNGNVSTFKGRLINGEFKDLSGKKAKWQLLQNT